MMIPKTILIGLCVGLLTLCSESMAQRQRVRGVAETSIPEEPEPIPQYKKYIRREPFLYHTWGRRVLARTGEAASLELLLADYKKPPAYDEYARYTMAELFGRYYGDHTWSEQFAALRKRHDGPGDMWLWVNTLALSDDPEDLAQVVQMIRETKSVLHRSAGIAALAVRRRGEVLAVIPEVCAQLPKKSKAGDRRMLIGALSSAILANKGELSGDKMQRAIRAYIYLLDEEVDLTHSAKMVIARYLAKTIGKDRRYIQAEPWIRLLDQNYRPPKRSGNTVSQSQFFGIEAEGDRICYVVDMSNSMLRPIDPALLKKGPVTGPKRKKKRKGQMPDENDIPWHLIKSRFDLAREHLKISIQRLGKDKRFCIVWFGDACGLLKSTPGMIRASRGNVFKVIKELDGLRPSPRPPNLTEADAPHGILKGQTNLHGGLRRAFALRAKGFAKKYDYVDSRALSQGCDTIFLITDGTPSMDDFCIKADDFGDLEQVREREYGRRVERMPIVSYPGPMSSGAWIHAELRRMNIFRKVPVHCIGIGEADIPLLRALAEMTDGQVHLIGAKAKAAGKGK